jgi:Raf kinase inhibitor-like YbhB/YbcL family protein
VRAAALVVAALVGLGVSACGGSTSTSPSASSSNTTSAASSATTAASTSESVTTPPASTTGGGTDTLPKVKLASGFHLTSPAFRPGGPIPRVYTCDGRRTSLPLRWTGVPHGTKELVLVMRDPDAPGGTFTHWAIAGIAPTSAGFPSGGVSGQVIPGRNSSGSLGYSGPCPPAGAKAHHYVLTLSALAAPSGLKPGFNPDQLQSQALGIATLIGTYARH